MNDEIKEILDILQNCKDYDDEVFLIKQHSATLLLDYITNLQKENEEWAMIFDTFSKRPYAHKYLEEKKKELGNDKIIGLDSEMIYKDYYNCKSILDKAVEYFKYQLENLDFYEDTKAKMLCAMGITLLQNGSGEE